MFSPRHLLLYLIVLVGLTGVAWWDQSAQQGREVAVGTPVREAAPGATPPIEGIEGIEDTTIQNGARERSPGRAARRSAAARQVDPAWVAGTADRAGIPPTALRAYAQATLAAPKGCEIAWNTLAGIGWVESQHGTLDGRVLGDDGHSQPSILGPALDGVDYAAIPSTRKSQRWHGDPDWDHAVGPLQFIPSTWSRWGRDGDGDGVEDPNDIDDAAAAAVAYLCADGHDLTTGMGWSDAVFGYNHSADYVARVFEAARSYAERVR